jgi:pyroglutamyl-peptidase
LDVKTNPSWEIVALLPSLIEEPSLSVPIRIITQSAPLEAVYQTLLSTVPPLLEKHNPDFVIHIGLAADRNYFAIEKGAERDGYHQIPDEERKVVTRAEAKRIWGNSPARLDSSIHVDNVVTRWQTLAKAKRVKSKSKGAEKELQLRASDDVGSYVCGLLYYITLQWFWKRKKAENVLFFHIPNLEGRESLEQGRDLTIALIKAVVCSREK